MDKNEIMNFVNANPVFSLATVDKEGLPHVRNMMIAFADERGLIFATGVPKNLYEQLGGNPAVELCFLNADKQCQVRISGQAELQDDLELKKQIVEKFTFLKPWIEQEGYEVLAAFRLATPRACVWTMETNSEPKSYIEL